MKEIRETYFLPKADDYWLEDHPLDAELKGQKAYEISDQSFKKMGNATNTALSSINKSPVKQEASIGSPLRLKSSMKRTIDFNISSLKPQLQSQQQK